MPKARWHHYGTDLGAFQVSLKRLDQVLNAHVAYTDQDVVPITDAEHSLGNSSKKWLDLHLAGTLVTSALSASGNVGIGGTLTVSGATTLKGALSVGGATVLSSNLTVGGTLTVSANGVFVSDVQIGSNAPLTKLHVTVDDTGLTGDHLGSATESIHYPIITESSDSVIALVSQAEGLHGSGLDLLEVVGGVLDSRWTIVRGTSNAGLTPAGRTRALAFYYGTDNYYPNNTRFAEFWTSGNIYFRSDQNSDYSFDVTGSRWLAFVGVEPRIRCVGEDTGTWGAAFTLDQIDVSNATDFENCWGMVRQTNGDGTGDGRLAFTYGTDPDPTVNTEILGLLPTGAMEVPGATTLGSTLTVSGATTLKGAVSVTSSLSVGGTVHIIRSSAEPALRLHRTDLTNSPRWDIGRMNAANLRIIYGDNAAGESEVMTLSSNGAVAMRGALSVSAAATLGSTLTVSGAATLKGTLSVAGNAAIGTTRSTDATTGFLYIPSCAGTPTGTPVSVTGAIPMIVDNTNNKLYFYSGGAWRDAGP